jgi:hypothetical protein
MQWSSNREALESPRIQEPHQHSRVKSCPAGHQVLFTLMHLNTAHQSTNGQFDCSCLCQQEGGGGQILGVGESVGRDMEKYLPTGSIWI